MRALKILYEDDHYVAVNKPAGLLVHRTEEEPGARRFAVQALRDQLGARVFPVHRLDKPTSGVLLFARSSEAAALAQEAFRGHRVSKEYLALCRGYLDGEGEVDHALDNRREARKAGRDPGPAREARTRYRGLGTTELPHAVGRYTTARYSWVQLLPQTGRKHQLRRHLKHLSHPIVGDTRFGDGQHNHFFRRHFNAQRLMLFAIRLQWLHPYKQVPLCVEAPLPKPVVRLLLELGLSPALPEPQPLNCLEIA